MSSFDSNHKSIIAKPRKKRSLKTTSSGLDSLPEILKQELTTTKEIKKTSLRLRKNHNNTTTDTNNDNNNNDLQVEKMTSRKRSIRASSKAIVQRTEQTDDVLEQATIAQTIEEPALEELVKKPRKKRKLKPQNNPIPNSTLLSGDELALEGHDDSGLSVYLNTSSPQPTPVTLGTPQKKRKMISKFRTPSPPPPSRSQSPPSTPQRLALSTVLSDLDLSKHTILPDLSYVVHMRDSKEESDSECNDESDINHDDVQALLFDTFPTRSMEEEAEYESDTSSVYFDAMSDIEEGEKT
ncbi:hypothetical protein K501DRAFT_278321 [Backusella circina FSU 941]|nr:hypothetical protein K501DRAFT_278321 [Backusella circina FSU 941]